MTTDGRFSKIFTDAIVGWDVAQVEMTRQPTGSGREWHERSHFAAFSRSRPARQRSANCKKQRGSNVAPPDLGSRHCERPLWSLPDVVTPHRVGPLSATGRHLALESRVITRARSVIALGVCYETAAIRCARDRRGNLSACRAAKALHNAHSDAITEHRHCEDLRTTGGTDLRVATVMWGQLAPSKCNSTRCEYCSCANTAPC